MVDQVFRPIGDEFFMDAKEADINTMGCLIVLILHIAARIFITTSKKFDSASSIIAVLFYARLVGNADEITVGVILAS